MRQVRTAGRAYKARYKRRVLKVPISLPLFTCPNIDGVARLGGRPLRSGCIYCKNESFSPNIEGHKNAHKNRHEASCGDNYEGSPENSYEGSHEGGPEDSAPASLSSPANSAPAIASTSPSKLPAKLSFATSKEEVARVLPTLLTALRGQYASTTKRLLARELGLGRANTRRARALSRTNKAPQKKSAHRGRHNSLAFIPYLQSFSNTYAPLELLLPIFKEALSLKDAIALSIGTRQDCIDRRLPAHLGRLSREYGKDITVELGLQSVHNASLDFIKRGHDFESILPLIKGLKAEGLRVCVHLIFGLPESDYMMLESFARVNALDIDAIKIHPLYVVEGTALARLYRNGTYAPLDKEHFARLLLSCLEMAREDLVFERISAGCKEGLLAPSWCSDKNYAMGYLRRYLLDAGFCY